MIKNLYYCDSCEKEITSNCITIAAINDDNKMVARLALHNFLGGKTSSVTYDLAKHLCSIDCLAKYFENL